MAQTHSLVTAEDHRLAAPTMRAIVDKLFSEGLYLISATTAGEKITSEMLVEEEQNRQKRLDSMVDKRRERYLEQKRMQESSRRSTGVKATFQMLNEEKEMRQGRFFGKVGTKRITPNNRDMSIYSRPDNRCRVAQGEFLLKIKYQKVRSLRWQITLAKIRWPAVHHNTCGFSVILAITITGRIYKLLRL